MRVRPQKPTTTTSSTAKTAKSPTNKKGHNIMPAVTAVSPCKLPNGCSLQTNTSISAPTLPQSPVSITLPLVQQSHPAKTSKDLNNSLTITPTVILSPQNSLNTGKRKRPAKSLDLNSEVSKSNGCYSYDIPAILRYMTYFELMLFHFISILG